MIDHNGAEREIRLKERARRLARPAAVEESEKSVAVVEFGLSQERYAFELQHVREIQPLQHLSPLPSTPEFLAGIVNLRGHFIPVYDLRKFFGLPARGVMDLHFYIVLQKHDVTLGILADSIGTVQSLPRRLLQEPGQNSLGINAIYLKCVTAEHLVVLDAAGILEDPNLTVSGPVPE